MPADAGIQYALSARGITVLVTSAGVYWIAAFAAMTAENEEARRLRGRADRRLEPPLTTRLFCLIFLL